jgi:hypothetical protein
LNVNTPASISGNPPPSNLQYGNVSLYGDSTSTITLTGGSITSPVSTMQFVGIGIVSQGSFSASGGLVAGANYVGNPFPGNSGGYGLLVSGEGASVQISGGTFMGGNGYNGGIGAVLASSGGVSVSGGNFEGGNSTYNLGVVGTGLEVLAGDNSITGGSFVGGKGGALGDYSLIYAAGGNSSSLSISGGTFSGPIEFFVGDGQSFFFLGSRFELNSVENQGLLTGTLADGSSIDLTLVTAGLFPSPWVASEPSGVEAFGFGVNPFAVPEPSSWLLLAFGGIGSAVANRRARSRPKSDLPGRKFSGIRSSGLTSAFDGQPSQSRRPDCR